MDSVNLHFGMPTGTWIIGKALSEMHDLDYDNDSISFIKMTFNKDKLNEAISKVKLITGSKQTQQGSITCIEMLESPAGDEYKLSDEAWPQFKEWLALHGKTEAETDNSITITAKKKGGE